MSTAQTSNPAAASAPASASASASAPTATLAPLVQGWLDAVLAVAAHYQIDTSRERLRVDAAWQGAREDLSGNTGGNTEGNSEALWACIRQMAQQAGLSVHQVEPRLAQLTAWRLPVAVQLRGGQVAVVFHRADQVDQRTRFE